MEPVFTCPKCTRTSHHPEDVRHGYCGACHEFTGVLANDGLYDTIYAALWSAYSRRVQDQIEAAPEEHCAALARAATVAARGYRK